MLQTAVTACTAIFVWDSLLTEQHRCLVRRTATSAVKRVLTSVKSITENKPD